MQKLFPPHLLNRFLFVYPENGALVTSVINGAISLLQNNDNAPYDVIYINALELDNKKTVLTYLLTKIRENLKARGVYVGINSEYKEFVSSLTGSLTSEAMGTLLQSQLSNDEDYRAQKKNLEEIFELVYRNGKLVVIVDDIERCDKNTAREYLFLIKEVATMKNCVSVFVTDYDILLDFIFHFYYTKNIKIIKIIFIGLNINKILRNFDNG